MTYGRLCAPQVSLQVSTTRMGLLCALRGGGLSAVYDALSAQGLMPFVMARHIILMRQEMILGATQVLQNSSTSLTMFSTCSLCNSPYNQ